MLINRLSLTGRIAFLLLTFLAVRTQATAATPAADINHPFAVYIGADGYRFSPLVTGKLGSVRLFGVLEYPDAPKVGDTGTAVWRLDVRQAGSRELVRTTGGRVPIDGWSQQVVQFLWDGRDDEGKLVEAGTYSFSVRARFVRKGGAQERARGGYDEVSGTEAQAGDDEEVVVDYSLTAGDTNRLRALVDPGACQLQQNAPFDVGFPFNFYYGGTHSHSKYSDGGHPLTACSTGVGTGTFSPSDVYTYARNNAGMDFWFITDHNHLFDDAISSSNPPVTEAKVLARYQDGLAAAAAASQDGAFVGVWGQEFGVISNGGHVLAFETPGLFGWETCSNCNGPTAECTPGTNCYFDYYVPKYTYLSFYAQSVAHPSPAGALGSFAHPNSTDFNSYAFDANADDAIQGLAVRSGLASSAGTSCSDANSGSSNNFSDWMLALNKGFHIAPTGESDAHCNNYGLAVPTRTVYLLSNGASPVLTKTALLEAHKARHFFASEDPNLQLVFGTSDNTHVMGDIFTTGPSVTLRAAVQDPESEAVSRIELWRGQIGGGQLTAAYQTFTSQSSFSVIENFTSGSYYYFVHAVQADGHDAWSAPMWITFNGSGCTPPASPVAGNNGPLCPGATLNLTASTVEGATYSWTGPAGFNSTLQNPVVSNVQPNQVGTYSVVAIVAECPSTPATTSVIVRSPTTTISAPSTLCSSSTGAASTPDGGVGATYAWTATNGQILAGQGTKAVTFGLNASGSATLDVVVQNAEGCTSSGSTSVNPGGACVPQTQFYVLAPCRVFDTRSADGGYGGPIIAAGETRTFTIAGTCTVPEDAVAVSGNITVTQPSAAGSFRFWAGDGTPTTTESISFPTGRTRANNLVFRLATDGSGTAKLENASAGSAHAILDVNGFFAPATSSGPTANQLAIRINEVDADQASTDTAEFLELVAPASTPLDGILVVFHNGSASFVAAGYRVQSLAGQTFPATPLVGGTKSLFVLGPAALAGFTAQPYNVLYPTGWPATNAIQNAGANEGDGILVAFDSNANGAYDDGVDVIIDKLAYVQSGGADGGSATAAGFKSIYGSTGSTYLGIDSTTTSLGKNSDTIPAASGLTFNYTTNNESALVPSPGALNPGQTTGL